MTNKQIKAIAINLYLKAIIGGICSIASYVLCYVFFGWKLVLIFFLFEFSRNLLRSIDKIKDKLDM